MRSNIILSAVSKKIILNYPIHQKRYIGNLDDLKHIRRIGKDIETYALRVLRHFKQLFDIKSLGLLRSAYVIDMFAIEPTEEEGEEVEEPDKVIIISF